MATEEETRNPLEVRDLTTRVASGVDPEETTPWEQVAPRQIDGADLLRFEGYVTEIFTAFGLQLDTPGTRRTPTRFPKALYDATAGYEGDHKLMTVFRAEHRCDPDHLVGQVVEGPIPFYSLCEHHVLPFHGVAHVGYVSHDQIIGISKMTRLVRMFARRFTVQERLGEQIADAVVELTDPHGGGAPGRRAPLHADAGREGRALEDRDDRVEARLHGRSLAAAGVPGRGAQPESVGVTAAGTGRTAR